MSKSKHSGKIVEDHDGSFYCLKCGQAGFKTKSAGYGHLTTCKGYKSAVNKITKELKELGFKGTTSTKIETNQLEEVLNMDADDTHSSSAHISEKSAESGPSLGHPRATLGPPSGPPSTIPDNVKLELMRLKIQNEHLSKLAYNHNQHYPVARQNFSGPMDIVGDVYSEVKRNDSLFRLITLGLMVFGGVLLWERIDKLINKGKNRRK